MTGPHSSSYNHHGPLVYGLFDRPQFWQIIHADLVSQNSHNFRSQVYITPYLLFTKIFTPCHLCEWFTLLDRTRIISHKLSATFTCLHCDIYYHTTNQCKIYKHVLLPNLMANWHLMFSVSVRNVTVSRSILSIFDAIIFKYKQHFKMHYCWAFSDYPETGHMWMSSKVVSLVNAIKPSLKKTSWLSLTIMVMLFLH